MAGVQSFLDFNEIMLNWKKIAKYCPEEVSNNLRGYTREEIAKLLSEADLRDRCLILLMASTGIRVGAIKGLKIKHVRRLQADSVIQAIIESARTGDKGKEGDGIIFVSTVDQAIDIASSHNRKVSL